MFSRSLKIRLKRLEFRCFSAEHQVFSPFCTRVHPAYWHPARHQLQDAGELLPMPVASIGWSRVMVVIGILYACLVAIHCSTLKCYLHVLVTNGVRVVGMCGISRGERVPALRVTCNA